MSKQMSKIAECLALECAYNQDKKCCTMAINVGDFEPMCDTYMPSQFKGGLRGMIAGVGACKVSNCVNNKDLICAAGTVRLQLQGEKVMCATYKAS